MIYSPSVKRSEIKDENNSEFRNLKSEIEIARADTGLSRMLISEFGFRNEKDFSEIDLLKLLNQ